MTNITIFNLLELDETHVTLLSYLLQHTYSLMCRRPIGELILYGSAYCIGT